MPVSLPSLNPALRFEPLEALETLSLGRVLPHLSFPKTISYLKSIKDFPEAVRYEPSLPELESLEEFSRAAASVFGGMPVQAGICIGHNRKLNAMEWHKGSEIVVAATPLVLLLDHGSRVREGRYSTETLRAFEMPAGSAVELYAGTLHFAPLETSAEGFLSAILLPRGTNTPLESLSTEEPMLFMRNKWLIAHPQSPSAARGAHVGIMGENLSLQLP